MKINKIRAAGFAACLALLLPGCASTAELSGTAQLFAMDTVMLITAYGGRYEAGLDAAEAVISDLDAKFTPNGAASDIHAINEGAGASVPVSEDTLNVLSAASEWYRSSNGAFDPTTYPLTRLWGFDTDNPGVPSADRLSETLKHVGFSAVSYGDGEASIPEGYGLDFGAIAKGYASEKAVRAMRDAGADAGIVSLGGNVEAFGTKPDGSLWSVAVQDPVDTGSYVGKLFIPGGAVVTSGNYQRYFTQNGVRYCHIIDPGTGYPVRNGLLSVTIVCENGTKADALSTALFVMGEGGALRYYRDNGGFEMVIITDDGRVVVTPGVSGSFEESGEGWTYAYPDAQ